eukprot:scaffold73640_cov34-Phaeocystis_antarctica.AAC.1
MLHGLKLARTSPSPSGVFDKCLRHLNGGLRPLAPPAQNRLLETTTAGNLPLCSGSTFGSFGERDQTGDEHEAIGGASCSEATVLSEAGHLIILRS